VSLRFDRLVSLLIVGTLVLVSSAGHAAGFNCSKAASAAEKAICANDTLSKLDEKLSDAWTYAPGLHSGSVATKASQVQWLKLRDACGADVSCLKRAYTGRLAALVNAQFPAGADQSGNRLEALVPKDDSTDADAEGCTADKRICVQLDKVQLGRDANAPAVMRINYAGASPFTYRFTLPDTGPDSQDTVEYGTVTLWPRVLRPAGDNDAILVGAIYYSLTGYSGGSGSASELRLFWVSRNQAASQARKVLSVPIGGSLSTRACFSDEDERKQGGVCRDETNFIATLGLDPTVTSGFPLLAYRTRATSPRCTYKRTFQLKRGSGVYMPDQPLPNCDDVIGP